MPAHSCSLSQACQQAPASQSGSPNSHSLSLLFEVMPWPLDFSGFKQNQVVKISFEYFSSSSLDKERS